MQNVYSQLSTSQNLHKSLPSNELVCDYENISTQTIKSLNSQYQYVYSPRCCHMFLMLQVRAIRLKSRYFIFVGKFLYSRDLNV